MPRYCFLKCEPGAPVHIFPDPVKFVERFKTWVKLVGGRLESKSDIEFFKNKRLCHRHFAESDHNRNNRLNIMAIPSLFLPDKTQNEGINKNHSLPTKNINYTTNMGAFDDDDNDSDDDNIKDGDINAGLRLGADDSEIYEVVDDTDDVIMYEEDPYQESDKHNDETITEIKIDDTPEKQEHAGFQCNCCKKKIVGYLYSCVQCHNFDLCSACELRGAHALHYMLRVPGPRPYEEVQSMLELIRRQVFQSDMLFKPDDASISADSIKLEVKNDIEEVDTLQSATPPASVSLFLAQADKLEDTKQEKGEETDAESTTNSPLGNVSHKRTPLYQQTHFQPKRKSDGESTTYFSSENAPIKPTWSHGQAHFSQKRKYQDSDESHKESSTDLPSAYLPSNSTSRVWRTYYPPKRKPKHQIPKSYSKQHIDNKNPTVVLSGIYTLEL